MGQEVPDRAFTHEDRQRYREKVRMGLDALATMLGDDWFTRGGDQGPSMGLEIEMNLVDAHCRPAMSNAEVLEKIGDPAFTHELGQHNIELNAPPRSLAGDTQRTLESDLVDILARADRAAQDADAGIVMIGILPTLTAEHFDLRWLSPTARYALLNEQILAARGEEMVLHLDGIALPGRPAERLRSYADSILYEAACTSVQLHIQVAPEDFAAHWNAAQCLAGVQVAIGANSPFLLGKALWHETRIPLFQQATDTRPEELKNQGVRPRVWFGERWITSIFDLFEENVRYFPALLPETTSEDPLAELDAGRAPALAELRLHNGTVWRWNRPVYDVSDGVPHLRVENRVLPSGPTVVDLLANAAFFYGAQRALVDQERPIWTRMSFHAAEENLYAAARNGMSAQLYWPGIGWIPPDELVLRVLLPQAHDGLRALGMSPATADHYLGVIEQRCLTRRTGATWQRESVATLESRNFDRPQALHTMLSHYIPLMHTNTPIHTWPSL